MARTASTLSGAAAQPFAGTAAKPTRCKPRPELFPVLWVLADRPDSLILYTDHKPFAARFLVDSPFR